MQRSATKPWFDHDEQRSCDDLATHLGIDVRFLRIAEQAGMELSLQRTISIRQLWRWFGANFQEFRRVAGMRPWPLRKTTRGYDRELERFEAALLTIVEFFGCLPCEHAIHSASAILRPQKRRFR